MSDKKYTPVIGMEIHVELKTDSKMFCSCKNDPFGADAPNTHTCPVCLGMPGALPVANKKAVEWTIRLSRALNCEISRFSKFDRKHYSYPDLPKGYQISQYDQPIGHDGWLEIGNGDKKKRIRIRRVHLEEDTGKLVHDTVNGENVSLVDFNRSSVPLVEIVTEPDIRSAEEAKEFAWVLHRIVRYSDVSDADMEKGSMRLEANVSVSSQSEIREDNLPPYKVELKNINSFRFMALATEYEIKRQIEAQEKGEALRQETRGWDEAKKATRIQRIKEDAQEYRYFPDPDLPPMRFSEEMLARIEKELPRMPHEYAEDFSKLGISAESVDVLIDDEAGAKLVSSALTLVEDGKAFANWFLRKREENTKLSAEELAKQFKAEKGSKVTDPMQIAQWVDAVIAENPQQVAEFKAGKEAVLMFFVGKVQKLAQGKADAPTVIATLKSRIAA